MSEQRLDPAHNLTVIVFGNRTLYAAMLCHGNQGRREVSCTEEDGEIRHEAPIY